MVSLNKIQEAFLIELRPFFERLNAIYDSMDQTYEETARYYGFKCSGCDDNCCMTHFYHHTHIEFFYIVKGFRALRQDVKDDILSRAAYVQNLKNKDTSKNEPPRVMCPLNINGKCVVYKYRPMICRMHGIPHELKKPGLPIYYGKGCDLFMEKYFNDNYVPFDRTPFYVKMAGLENDMKGQMDLNAKFKKTISEMLTT